MAEYKLEVTTGDMVNAGTFDHIFVTLIGTGGKSERTELDNEGVDFQTGMVSWIQLLVFAQLNFTMLVLLHRTYD